MDTKRSGQSVIHGNVEGLSPDNAGPIVGLGERYFATMNQYKDKLHQVDALTGVTETKGSVRSRAIKVAIELRNRGVQQNQVVVISSKTHLDQTVAVLASLFVGAAVAPLHTDLPYDDTKRLMGILQPKVAFCGQRSARLYQRVFKEKSIKCLIFRFGGDGKDFLEFAKCLDNKEDSNFVPTEIKEPKKTTAFIVATHGTEHDPQLVAISHYGILMRYIPMISMCTKAEKLLTFFPLSWMTQVLVCCMCFENQSKIIYAGQFTERSACKFIHDLRVEFVFLDGAFATKIVKNAPIQDFDLTCLKVIWIGGMHLSKTSFAKIAKTFRGVSVISSYSTIESGAIAMLTESVYFTHKEKISSVGQPNPGVLIRIQDDAARNPRGPVVTDKWGELYYGDQYATNKAFSRGYFKTGDVAQCDAEGFLYLRGRITDDIKREGHVFSSCEIEDIIRLHPAVDEAAVFSTNEEIIACIVKSPGHDLNAAVVKEYLSDMLPPYKQPTKISFYEFFPKTLHGQVKKYILKDNIIKLIREESFYHSEHVEDV
ncbi:long-chain-fatty-acid--coa ligase [Holotrichia oblita]|uniref:Long-chain-fatty-acid--coa ligase n=1 Tax=Holotrichia oblita TaxID=644536 RepID=A0ACB9TXD5_HOLOL|nr:long-chain-fatty-acid--coa ligase [Holotrichia oblita]